MNTCNVPTGAGEVVDFFNSWASQPSLIWRSGTDAQPCETIKSRINSITLYLNNQFFPLETLRIFLKSSKKAFYDIYLEK